MTNILTKLTQRDMEYLKEIYVLSTEGIPLVGPAELSKCFSVARPTAFQVLKKLESCGCLKRYKSKGYSLTDDGIHLARQIIRNHRIFETYLVRVLNVSLDEACRITKPLEASLDKTLIDKLCTLLGHPEKCPHGEPIPPGKYCPRRGSE